MCNREVGVKVCSHDAGEEMEYVIGDSGREPVQQPADYWQPVFESGGAGSRAELFDGWGAELQI